MKSTITKARFGTACGWATRRTVALTASALAVVYTAAAVGKPPESRIRYGQSDARVQAPEGVAELPVRPIADLKGPRAIIKAVQDVHDFGSIWVGPQLKHTFTLKNEGDAALQISAVKPSCGCTVAGDYPKTLEPGQSGEFPFAMHSTKLHGSFAKHVTITSNDPVTPNLRLTLRGEVKQYVEITPSSASFGRITDQEPKTRELMILNNTDKPITLEPKPEPGDPFEYKIEELEKNRRYALKVSTKPPYQEGTLNAALRLSTGIEEQSEIVVRTIANVPPRIEVQPNAILISERGETTTGEPIARMIRYTNYGKSPAKLLEATVDDPTVSVAVRERKEGEAYTVEVQLPPGYRPTSDKTITLKTDDAELPEIKVPIRSTARPRPDGAETAQVKRTTPDDLVGKPAPTFAMQTIDGKPLTTDMLKDHVTILNFFAPNCGYCKKQIPRLESVRQQFESKGVRIVNVSQKMGREFQQDDVVKIVNDLGFRGELALNHDNSVGGMFNASGFPTMVVIGKDGKVAAVNVGNIGDLESRLNSQIEALLAGKPVPAAAAPVAAAPETAKVAPAPTPAAAAPAQRPLPPREPHDEFIAQQPTAQPATPPAAQPPAQPAAQPAAPAAPKPARIRPDDLVGKPAPAFSTKTIEGKDVSNDTLKNSPATVLNFFANNCGFCKKQIPRLDAVSKEFEGKGIRFINVAETMRQEFTPEQTMETMKQLGWTHEVIIDSKNEIGPLFGGTGYPTMVVLGKDGKVAAANVGNIADLETRVKGQLTALAEGKPIPAEFVQAPKQAERPPGPESKIGHPAPAFALTTIDGKSLTNADLASNAATVLNFMAPNCGFCKKQIPRVETVQKEFDGKPVRFVNVIMTMGKEFSQEEAMAVLKETGWSDEVARDPKNEVGPKFGVSGFPTMVVVGKNGKVQAVHVGNVADLETKLKSQLEDLVAGKELAATPAPAAAPAAPKKRPAEELIGQPAPEFALTTMDGKAVASADFGKHPATVLNFVAPNCGFCKKQVPNVDKVRAEYESKGVRFVNVAEKMGAKEFPNEEIIKIFKDAGSNLEMAKDEGNQVGQKYKATSFPTMVVVGKDGKIANVFVGAKADLEALLKTQLDQMMK